MKFKLYLLSIGFIRLIRKHLRGYIQKQSLLIERNKYDRLIKKNRIHYVEANIIREVKARLLQKGIGAKVKGELHTVALFAHVNWEKHNFIPALGKCGTITHFDYGDLYEPYKYDKEKKNKMNRTVLDFIERTNREQKIDLLFFYTSGRWFEEHYVERIAGLGIPTYNFIYNDLETFEGENIHGQLTGVAQISRHFDFVTTTIRDNLNRYLSVRSRPFHIIPAASPQTYYNKFYPENRKNIDVVFIGQNYGIRSEVINYLRRNGISVVVKGKGWEGGEASIEEMVELLNRSKIALGFPETHFMKNYGDAFRGRDFEFPLTGVFYITKYFEILSTVFTIGTDVEIYHDSRDLLEKIRFYLRHPELRSEIAENGYKKVLRYHTWEKRFEDLFMKVGVLQ